MAIPTISKLPAPPSSANPVDFDTKADAFLGAFPTLRTEINATVAALEAYIAMSVSAGGSGNTGHSVTNLTIGLAGKVFIVEGDKPFVPGQRIAVWNIANSVGMAGTINSVTKVTEATGYKTSVVFTPTDSYGSGTYSDWYVFLVPTTGNMDEEYDGASSFFPPSVQAVKEYTATEARAGLAELATPAETNTGTDATRIVTPYSLARWTVPRDLMGLFNLPIQPTFNMFAPNLALPPMSFFRASPGSRLNAAETIEVLGNNVPRFDFAADGSVAGLLMEGATTNLALYSNAFEVTHQLALTGGSGTFQVGETVTGGTGSGVVVHVATGLLGLKTVSGTFSGTVTGGTSGATGTFSAITAMHVHSNTTVAGNVTIGPDGTTSADKLQENAANAEHSWAGPAFTVTANVGCTAQIKVKAAERTKIKLQLSNSAYTNGAYAFFDLSAGTVGAVSYLGTGSSGTTDMRYIGNGFWQCSITCILDTTSTSARVVLTMQKDDVSSYAGTTGYGVYLAQFQAEAGKAGTSPTSYVEANSASVNRSADVASVDLAAIDFNPRRGTIFCDFTPYPWAAERYILTIDNCAPLPERLDLYITNTNILSFRSVLDGVTATRMTFATLVPYTRYRIAVAFSETEFRGVVNGGAVRTTASSAMPSGLVSMFLGMIRSGSQLHGTLRQVAYFPRDLTAAQLQAITL